MGTLGAKADREQLNSAGSACSFSGLVAVRLLIFLLSRRCLFCQHLSRTNFAPSEQFPPEARARLQFEERSYEKDSHGAFVVWSLRVS
jgi:hypothetical protein